MEIEKPNFRVNLKVKLTKNEEKKLMFHRYNRDELVKEFFRKDGFVFYVIEDEIYLIDLKDFRAYKVTTESITTLLDDSNQWAKFPYVGEVELRLIKN